MISQDNHYVPQLYLKNFADRGGFLYRYRVLVSNASVPIWKRFNVAGVGYQRHLYTRTLSTADSDEIELWLNRDFENPAKGALAKVVNEEQLSKEDYRLLTRFAAAQMVRTPAFLIKNLPRWRAESEKQSTETLEQVRTELIAAKSEGRQVRQPKGSANAKYYPMRITHERSNDSKTLIKVQTVVGRGTWLFAMRHLLTETINKFTHHKWSIIHSEDDLPWFTTDDPVIALNFRSVTDYDFGGGWGVPHTNILLPLSPRHLLYTQIGDKRPPNGTIFPRNLSAFLRQIIAEHAHRYIFATNPDAAISSLRSRRVDAEMVRRETEEWRKWHHEQSQAERELLAEPKKWISP